jgi:hypothetical protein
MTHFDTNFLIQATKAGSPAHTQFQQWAAANESFGISAVAWAEYLCGPLDPAGEALARSMFPVPENLQRTRRGSGRPAVQPDRTPFPLAGRLHDCGRGDSVRRETGDH